MTGPTPIESGIAAAPARRGLSVSGAVQGVGFRPFAYRLAVELGLSGFVANDPAGVRIEIEGRPAALDSFEHRLLREAPAHARVERVAVQALEPAGAAGFAIRPSATGGEPRAIVLPDLATCSDCRREVFSPADRRYRYPFTNCTRCGPRYSIVLDLPYDRSRTTMARFPMCRRCRAEYEDPDDRRFHAEPIACPDCGPHVELWDAAGASTAAREAALEAAAAAVRSGAVLALKGLGGFHLIVDARDEDAVRRLRGRKRRPTKPLAVMASSLEQARDLVELAPAEIELLLGSEAPIVLARRRPGAIVAGSVAPGNPYLGVFLPYTPLHHVLLDALRFPVVATSGNRSDEPLCIDEREALSRLQGIADVFLVHDRAIARPIDDSVVRLVAGRPLPLRRARGYAPFPVAPGPEQPLLAVGAHQKSTIALTVGGRVVLSPHIGDLDTEPARAAYRATTEALARLYRVTPERVVCDAHPDYASTRYARETGAPLLAVQHHHAHALSCLADNGLAPPALALTWDGSGYGADGTVWGGEVLRIRRDHSFERFAWLRPFGLPGGEAAVREPRRVALALLYEAMGEDCARDPWVQEAFAPGELDVLLRMLRQGVQCPPASSMGRLFDAVAAWLDLSRRTTFEGEAAMALEFAVDETCAVDPYPFALRPSGSGLVIDWAPMLEALRADRAVGAPAGRVASRFHDTLAAVAAGAAGRAGERRVLLTGGCFQNKTLTERVVAALRRGGHEPFWHREVPPNDGGIALGQIVAARQEAGGA